MNYPVPKTLYLSEDQVDSLSHQGPSVNRVPFVCVERKALRPYASDASEIPSAMDAVGEAATTQADGLPDSHQNRETDQASQTDAHLFSVLTAEQVSQALANLELVRLPPVDQPHES